MAERHRFVLLDDPFNEPSGIGSVEFRLLYRGPLRATQNDPKPGSGVMAKHWELKHEIRKRFSTQLQDVWRTDPTLSLHQSGEIDGAPWFKPDSLKERYQIPPWSFVPLVTHFSDLLCGIEVTLLRLDHPGDSIWTGDVDNRLKTLIDALRVPGAQDGYGKLIPEAGENPLFCLLEDDKLLTKVSVETDRLLDAPEDADRSFANVTVKVSIRPHRATMANIGI